MSLQVCTVKVIALCIAGKSGGYGEPFESFSHAIRVRDETTLRSLAKRYKDEKVISPYGQAPAHYVASEGYAKGLSILVHEGYKVDSVEDTQRATPLILAATHANSDCVRILLRAGANPNRLTEDGRSPLFWSVHNGDVKSVRMLLQRGAKVNPPTSTGETSLMRAMTTRAYRFEIVRLLLHFGADPALRDQKGRSAISLAKTFGRDRALSLMRR